MNTVAIGTTVMVLLDSETWQRGDGLARLRNPIKAQELVQRIHRKNRYGRDGAFVDGQHSEGEYSEGKGGGENGAPNGQKVEPRTAIASERTDEAFVRWARGELRGSPLLASCSPRTTPTCTMSSRKPWKEGKPYASRRASSCTSPLCSRYAPPWPSVEAIRKRPAENSARPTASTPRWAPGGMRSAGVGS